MEFLSETHVGRTPDALLDGARWEFKAPWGFGQNNVVQTIRDARGQSGRILVDLARSPLSLTKVLDQVDQALKRYDGIEVVRVLLPNGEIIDRRP